MPKMPHQDYWSLRLDRILKTHQPRPFLKTSFGRLPPEIREMIYGYVLIFPPAPSPICLRVPSFKRLESKKVDNGVVRKASRPEPRKASYLTILQTCHQIYNEAYHIFYAQNDFHFPDPKILLTFLVNIGPARRKELTSLCLGGLVTNQLIFSNSKRLDLYCRNQRYGPLERERVAAYCYPEIDPDARQAARLLRECKNLRKIGFDLAAGQEYMISNFLLEVSYFKYPGIRYVNAFRWVVRPSSVEGRWWSQHHTDFGAWIEYEREVRSRAGLWYGDEHYLEVKIQQDPIKLLRSLYR